MNAFVMSNEPYLRLGFFFGVFGLMALLETAFPRRQMSIPRSKRWINNLGITTLNALLVRVVFVTGAAGAALASEENGWGLFNLGDFPFWARVIVSVMALDFIIYLQHAMFHFIPLFWRLHMVHHTDLDVDVTTGARFHPVEILLSMAIKMSAVVILGAPVLAVFIFEVLLNATSMFNHSNVRINEKWDGFLRLLVVTPDMHRVHHSVIIKETNSNFGFNMPWWDRLLGTYRAQPTKGHQAMTIGLANYRDHIKLGFFRLLILPLTGRR